MITDGQFYITLNSNNSYSPELQNCIKETVQKLIDNITSINKPGMLLGKIQSGKTRTYLGVIGLAFDNGFDVAIILTKGTKALAQQTYQRLEREFGQFREKDQLQIFDIMEFPHNLTQYILNQKIIIISKKQKDNLQRLHNAIFTIYPSLSRKRILIIDDEADLASVGFKRTRAEGIKINRIASQINSMRGNLQDISFLQVTATPYSLYLQPDDDTTNQVYEPKRPSFTELVPIHDGYIGGDYYFERSTNQDSIASFIYEEVPPEELEIIQREDRRRFRIEEALISQNVRSLRDALINFIVGGCIRRLQAKFHSEPIKKFSFIVHTESTRRSHRWQETVAREIIQQLIQSITTNRNLFNQLIEHSYLNLARSIRLLNSYLPDLTEVNGEVVNALSQGYLMIVVVNSERNVNELLDRNGQLKLQTPLNIFIGGQILDRGITISNLIGFYYGRRPNRFQQDTVLQHSRMYGFRPLEDLTVTRFYTTLDIYDAMLNIHIFDSALRETFIRGTNQNGVVFLRKDNQNRIVPCSPNKILLSTTTTLRPNRRILPIGFQSGYKTNISKVVSQIDNILSQYGTDWLNSPPFILDIEVAKNIIDLISQTLIFDNGYTWNVDAFEASMEYLSKNSANISQRNNIHCLVRADRNLSRFKLDGSFSDAPDTASTEGRIARETAIDIPILILFRQNGLSVNGWRDCAFWWPVLYTPTNTQTVIFASDFNEV